MTRSTLTRVAGPPAGVVQVWVVTLAVPQPAYDALVASLDHEERRHAERMHVGGREWAATHGALRMILAGYVGQPAAALRFARTATGKPRLAGSAGLEFSLARTDGLAVIAVASDRAVGVDVERENDRTDIEIVAREFLPPLDAAALEWTAPERRRSAFFAAWARHEARLKLHGHGLGERSSEPALEPDALVVVRALATRPGFAAAVAAEGGGWTVDVRDLAPPGIGA